MIRCRRRTQHNPEPALGVPACREPGPKQERPERKGPCRRGKQLRRRTSVRPLNSPSSYSLRTMLRGIVQQCVFPLSRTHMSCMRTHTDLHTLDNDALLLCDPIAEPLPSAPARYAKGRKKTVFPHPPTPNPNTLVLFVHNPVTANPLVRAVPQRALAPIYYCPLSGNSSVCMLPPRR